MYDPVKLSQEFKRNCV